METGRKQDENGRKADKKARRIESTSAFLCAILAAVLVQQDAALMT
jgi:hypothetical protein